MPRHRSLNLKKFVDSIPESWVEEHFNHKVEGRGSPSLKTFDYCLPGLWQLFAFVPLAGGQQLVGAYVRSRWARPRDRREQQ